MWTPEPQRCEGGYLWSPNFYTRAYISIVEYLKTMHNSDNYVIAAHCAEYTEADTGGEYEGVWQTVKQIEEAKENIAL